MAPLLAARARHEDGSQERLRQGHRGGELLEAGDAHNEGFGYQTREGIITAANTGLEVIALTHFAHVVSPESFAALSALAMASGIAGSFQLRIFGGVPEARAWLRAAR